MAERTRRSVAARTLIVLMAFTMWLSPLQLSLQQARQAAGVLAAGAVAVDTPAVLAGAARQGWLRWAVMASIGQFSVTRLYKQRMQNDAS